MTVAWKVPCTELWRKWLWSLPQHCYSPVGWVGLGREMGMNRLRTIQVSALLQHLRLSSRDSKEEVRGTCQIGISISQTLHMLSWLMLPHKRRLLWWWWLKLAGRSPREQGNLLGKGWTAARKKGEGLLENLSHLKNMTNITLLLKFSVISVPKLFFSKGTKEKSGHLPVPWCTWPLCQPVEQWKYSSLLKLCLTPLI